MLEESFVEFNTLIRDLNKSWGWMETELTTLCCIPGKVSHPTGFAHILGTLLDCGDSSEEKDWQVNTSLTEFPFVMIYF